MSWFLEVGRLLDLLEVSSKKGSTRRSTLM